MDHQLYTEHLHKLWFAGRTVLRYYESDHPEGSTQGDSCETADEVWSKISDENVKSMPSLTLIAGLGDGRHLPISVTTDMFTQILDHFKFPRISIQSLSSNQGSLASFVDYEKVENEYLPAYLAIVIHTPYSPIETYSCVIRISVVTCTAICFLLDFREGRIDSVLGRLRIRQQQIQKHPLALLNILYEEHCSATEKSRHQLDDDVVSMERRTGMTSLIGAHGSKYHEIDHEKLIRDLHACNTNLIFLNNGLEFEVEMGKFVTETVVKFKNLHSMRACNALLSPNIDMLLEGLGYCLNSSLFRMKQARSLMKRVKSQINVLYSLISQRDSRINQKIAEAAMRDSKTMKTIAIMTLVFLPGTLVASIFSSGIFDLRTQDVAPLWWTLVVATVLLTIIVLGSWIMVVLWAKSAEGRKSSSEKVL